MATLLNDLDVIRYSNAPSTVPRFSEKLRSSGLTLDRGPLEILQINIGKLCNQACKHCHVEAGPTKKKENMDEKTVHRLLELLEKSPTIHTVDITGGAPELNQNFRYLVSAIRSMNKKVIDRCNLTVLFTEGQEDTAEFLSENEVEIVASLPCYSKKNVDQQRGRGVFDKSIRALKRLNGLGYGKANTGRVLNLVYNPVGPHLPPPQAKLESDYKKELKDLFDIDFNHLFTITNMPIKRFLDDLLELGRFEEYMGLLANSFNASTVDQLMCRNQLSVGWDGQLYDCDFNQMLEIPHAWDKKDLWAIDRFDDLLTQPIAVADHCYGCTAGSGSSCGGALA